MIYQSTKATWDQMSEGQRGAACTMGAGIALITLGMGWVFGAGWACIFFGACLVGLGCIPAKDREEINEVRMVQHPRDLDDPNMPPTIKYDPSKCQHCNDTGEECSGRCRSV